MADQGAVPREIAFRVKELLIEGGMRSIRVAKKEAHPNVAGQETSSGC